MSILDRFRPVPCDTRPQAPPDPRGVPETGDVLLYRDGNAPACPALVIGRPDGETDPAVVSLTIFSPRNTGPYNLPAVKPYNPGNAYSGGWTWRADR